VLERTLMALGAFMALLTLATPGMGRAQLVSDVVVEARPTPVPLGQIVELEIRIRTVVGWGVEAPDSIPGLRDFRQTGPVGTTQAAEDSGDQSWEVTYPLVPLRSGYRPLPALTLVLTGPEGGRGEGTASSQTIRVPLNGVSVQSVLPPPGQPVSPAPPRFPTGPENAGSPFLLWAFLGSLLTGSGWVYLRRMPGRESRERWGGNDDHQDDQEAPDLTEQLCQVLRGEVSTEVERACVFDRSFLLIRQILESRSPKTLSAFTTSELVDYLRNGSGLRNANTLEAVLTAGENVRYRRTPPTEVDLREFREGLMAWLESEDPRVGRKRAGDKDV